MGLGLTGNQDVSVQTVDSDNSWNWAHLNMTPPICNPGGSLNRELHHLDHSSSHLSSRSSSGAAAALALQSCVLDNGKWAAGVLGSSLSLSLFLSIFCHLQQTCQWVSGSYMYLLSITILTSRQEIFFNNTGTFT